MKLLKVIFVVNKYEKIFTLYISLYNLNWENIFSTNTKLPGKFRAYLAKYRDILISNFILKYVNIFSQNTDVVFILNFYLVISTIVFIRKIKVNVKNQSKCQMLQNHKHTLVSSEIWGLYKKISPKRNYKISKLNVVHF